MVKIKKFKALCPKKEFVSTVSSLPYDVVSKKEAVEVIKRHPDSFLKVIKPEATVPFNKKISYDKLTKSAANNLKDLIDRGIMISEQEECFYIYQQISRSSKRTGLVACLSIDDYRKGLIKQHEKIRTKTWQERVQHIRATRAHTGCALIIYKSDPNIEKLVEKEMVAENTIYDFISDDGVRNCCWKVTHNDIIISLSTAFLGIKSLYIADGHHRVAAAAEMAKIERQEKKKKPSPDNEYSYFPAVLIPHNQIQILGYHRLIRNLNRFSGDCFLNKLRKKFEVERITPNQPFLPSRQHEFGMNMSGHWYRLFYKDNSINEECKNIIDCLDVSILHNHILYPILGIKDPLKSNKVEFIGGIQALSQLENEMQQGAELAFTLYPTAIDDVIKVSDNEEIMPSKSTWFEPKLRSGIFVHLF